MMQSLGAAHLLVIVVLVVLALDSRRLHALARSGGRSRREPDGGRGIPPGANPDRVGLPLVQIQMRHHVDWQDGGIGWEGPEILPADEPETTFPEPEPNPALPVLWKPFPALLPVRASAERPAPARLSRSALEELIGELRRGAGQPGIGDRFSQGALADLVQVDEHRGKAVEVGNGEDALDPRSEDGFLSPRSATLTARIGPSGGEASPNRLMSALLNARSQAKFLPATSHVRLPYRSPTVTSGRPEAISAASSIVAIGPTR